MSKSRASQGSFGALEDGRLIGSLSVVDLKSSVAAHGGDQHFQDNLSSELQRLVRLATGRLSPLPLAVQPTQVDQPRQLRSPALKLQRRRFMETSFLAPLVLGPAPGQVLSPTTASPAQSLTSRVAAPVVHPVTPPVAPPVLPQPRLPAQDVNQVAAPVVPHDAPQAPVPAQVPVFQSAHASQQILSMKGDCKSSPPSSYPFTTSSPSVYICHLSVL
jgi:hypothetical protein